jgi:hypothetical protein
MKTKLLKNKSIKLRDVLVFAIAIAIFCFSLYIFDNWADFKQGFREGLNGSSEMQSTVDK